MCETCHSGRGDALPCRHLSDIPAAGLSIAESLLPSLRDGNIVCTTCHDIVYQCERPKQYYSLENRGFLRDRTSRETGDYCYKCHEDSEYVALNPHKGSVGSRSTCQLCHQGMPASKASGEVAVELNFGQNLNDMCLGCHDVRPHPRPVVIYTKQQQDEWVHLVAPSQDVLTHMRNAEQAKGVVLPLNPQNGEVFCATCHNPHEFKVGGEHGSEERAIEHRLRVHDICQVCHEK